tara:strand:- start:3222 stop:3761 length:540 start_codon:yes stop_codon:yes gene_type:complete
VAKELRNLLKSQNLDTVQPTAFKQVGGVVFPDQMASRDLKDFDEIVKGFRSVHIPYFGHEIPSTNGYSETSVSSATTTKILTPNVNETVVVKALELTSAESGTSVVMRLEHDSNSLVISTDLTLTQNVPTAIVGVNLKSNTPPFDEEIKISYPYSLSVQTISGGTVDLAVKMLTIKTSQ